MKLFYSLRLPRCSINPKPTPTTNAPSWRTNPTSESTALKPASLPPETRLNNHFKQRVDPDLAKQMPKSYFNKFEHEYRNGITFQEKTINGSLTPEDTTLKFHLKPNIFDIETMTRDYEFYEKNEMEPNRQVLAMFNSAIESILLNSQEDIRKVYPTGCQVCILFRKMTSKQYSPDGNWHQDNLEWRGDATKQKITVIAYHSLNVKGGQLEVSETKDGSNPLSIPINRPGTIISFDNPNIWHRFTSFRTPKCTSRVLITLFCYDHF